MIRKFTFILFLLFLYCRLVAQTNPTDTANYPYWIDMAQDPNENYYKTVRAFDLYWENRPRVPHSGYKVFERWKEYWSHHIDAEGNREPANKNMQSWIDYNGGTLPSGLSVNSVGSGNWTSMGPHGTPSFSASGMQIGNGRINAFAFHATDSNKMIIGAPQGGAWLTTNNCQSWTPLTDQMPTLGVSAIVWDYSNPNIILLGTGDRDFGDAPGLGVYKSTNGGSTWAPCNLGISVNDAYALVQNPLNPNVMIAGTNMGCFYSSNKGNTWTWVYVGAHFKNFEYKPGDTSVLYSSTSGSFYRSADGGQTWTNMTSISGSGLPASNAVTRYLVGVSKASPNMVYLLAAYGSVYKGFYVSSDAGITFRAKSTTPNILGYTETGADGGGQAYYDLSLGTRSDSSNVIYTGGINVFKSIDTGATWDCVGHWEGSATAAPIHGDQHWMGENPVSKRLFAGCDGGLYSLQPNGTWKDCNTNMAISQIYRIGQSAFRAKRVIAGFQDNGCAIFDSKYGSNPWNNVFTADGMECIMDSKDSNTWYGSSYYGGIYRNALVGVSNPYEPGPWITPYLLHPDSNNVMFEGLYNIWRNKKVNATPVGTWEKLTTGTNNYINEVHVCRANPNILYFNKLSKAYRTSNSMAPVGSVFFDTITPPVNAQAFLDFETSFIDSNIVYGVLSDNNIYISTNRGATWTNYSAGLPTATKYCLLPDKNAKRGLYCGTFNGIYYRDSSMSSWTFFSTGMPISSAVREMDYYYDADNTKDCRVTACTYGRGLWQSVPYLENTAPVAAFGIADTNLCALTIYTLTDSTTGNPDYWRWTITPSTFTFMNGTNANSQHPQLRFNAPGNYTVKLYTRKDGYGYSTRVRNNYLKVTAAGTLAVSASNPSACKGDSVQLTATGGSGSYSWAPATGLSATSGNKVMASPGNTTYYYALSGNSQCMDSAGVTITILSRPSLTTSGNVFVCKGTPAILSAGGAASYRWSPSAGLNFDTGSTVIATPSVTTTYKITGTNANGCTDTASITLSLLGRPSLTTSASTTVCKGTSTTLSAGGAVSYRWSPSAGLNTDTGSVVIASPNTTTTYKVTGTGANGCTDSANITVTVIPKVILKTGGNVKICKGSSTVLKVSGATNYAWSPSAGLNTTFGDSVVANPLTSTMYTIIASQSGYCSDTDSVFVKAVNPPLLSVSTNGAICQGDSTELIAYGADAFEWSPATGLSATTGSHVYAKPSSSTTYNLKGTNDSTCSRTMAVPVTVYTLPTVSISPSGATIAVGQFVTLTASGATNYQWSPGAGLNTTAGNVVIASPVATTTYTVKGTDAQQCSNTFNVTVKVAASGLGSVTGKPYAIYPNPNGGTFILNTHEEGMAEIYSIEGKLLFTQKTTNGENTISLTTYTKGVYLMKYIAPNINSTERIIVK